MEDATATMESDPAVEELGAPSEDGESQSSTVCLEHQLDHLQILLAQAETEVGGRNLAANSDDLAELKSILGEPSILHLTTPENILDVLGFSEEPKKQPKKKPLALAPSEEAEVVPKEPGLLAEKEEEATSDAVNALSAVDPEEPQFPEMEEGSDDVEPQSNPAKEEEPDGVKPLSVEEEVTESTLQEEEEHTAFDAVVVSLGPSDEEKDEQDTLTEPSPPSDEPSLTPDAAPESTRPTSDETSDSDEAAPEVSAELEEAADEPLSEQNDAPSTQDVPEAPEDQPEAVSQPEIALVVGEEDQPEAAPQPETKVVAEEEEQPEAAPQPEAEAAGEEEETDGAEHARPRAEVLGTTRDEIELVVDDYINVQPDKEEIEEKPTGAAEESKEEEPDAPITEQDEPVASGEESTEQEAPDQPAQEMPANVRENTEQTTFTDVIASEEEKKEDDSFGVLVLPEPGSQAEERRESSSVELVLPSMSSGSLSNNAGEGGNETAAIQTSAANATSLPVVFEERDIVATTSDTIMFQSGKLLSDLKREVEKLRADKNKVVENNKRLSQANSSAGDSFESLNQHAQQLQKKLDKSEEDAKEANAALTESKTLVAELRDELALKQATYVAEVQSRLQYQNTLQEMADLVQNNCKDSSLVEKVLSLADKVEEESMAVPAMKTTEETNSVAESTTSHTEDTPTIDNKSSKTAKEQGGYMSYIKACVWTT